jgi:hypothetical protein
VGKDECIALLFEAEDVFDEAGGGSGDHCQALAETAKPSSSNAAGKMRIAGE